MDLDSKVIHALEQSYLYHENQDLLVSCLQIKTHHALK